MKCPNCGSQNLKIETTFSGYTWIEAPENPDNDTFDVLDTDQGDGEWEDESGVECTDCHHQTFVARCEMAASGERVYDARMEATEDHMRVDCGCVVERDDDGSVHLTYCVRHLAVSPWFKK